MQSRLHRFLWWAVVLGLLWTSPSLAQPAQAPADCSSPRRAVMTLIDFLQPESNRPEVAAACFDFVQFRGDQEAKQKIAVQLKAVLDARGLFVYEDRIPDDQQWRDERSRQPVYELFPEALPGVAVHKVKDQWLFTPRTVRVTPELHADTFAFGLETLGQRAPDALKRRVLGVPLWRLIALVLVVALAALVGRLLELLLMGAVRRFLRKHTPGIAAATEVMTRPVTLVMMCLILAPVIPSLGLTVKFSVVLLIALKVVATGSVVMVLYRMVDVLSRVMSQRAAKTDTRLDDQLVPLLRKTLKTTLVVIAVLFILQNLDVDVGSLLAGLGIGGLAFALAAKDTLANFFGSLMIFVDRPFQIGDWVKLNGVEGTVEEVGFRSTRVRTFYQSLVTIPNSSVADSVIDNMGERRYRRLKMVLGLTYGSTPEQVQAYVEGLRALLKRNPAVWYEGTQVHFYNYGASALEILVYSFLDVPDWSEELRQRHNLLLEMYRLADALGVSFAFPSQSIYLESTPESPARRAAPPRAELEAVVRGFGPGGELGMPEGDPISDSFGRGEDVMRGSGE